MARKLSNPENGIYRIDTLATGEYVRRITATHKTYRLAGYDRSQRKYQLDDCDDASRCIYIAPTAFVQAGFTY